MRHYLVRLAGEYRRSKSRRMRRRVQAAIAKMRAGIIDKGRCVELLTDAVLGGEVVLIGREALRDQSYHGRVSLFGDNQDNREAA